MVVTGRAGELRRGVFVRQAPGELVWLLQQILQFLVAETDQFEVEAVPFQLHQFLAEQVLIPAGEFRQSVIGDDVGPPLRQSQVVQHNDWNRGHFELSRCQQPAVPGNDAVLTINQDGVHEPELHNAGGDLGHLFIRMGARIPIIRDETVQCPYLNSLGHRWAHLFSASMN